MSHFHLLTVTQTVSPLELVSQRLRNVTVKCQCQKGGEK